MSEDANQYYLNTVKIIKDVVRIVRKDTINGGQRWCILPVVNNNTLDPWRYNLNPATLGMGARAYGQNKSKWQVSFDKQKSMYYWKLIDKNSEEEKDRLLKKLENRLNEYMSIFKEPEVVDMDDVHASSKICFTLKTYGVVFLKHRTKEMIDIAKIKLLRNISMYLFDSQDPRDNKKFLKKFNKIKKEYPDYEYLDVCYAALSVYINKQNGFVGKGSFKLQEIKDNKFNIIESKSNNVSLINLNTNFVHQECLRLLSSLNIWHLIKEVSLEYFASGIGCNEGVSIDYPHLVSQKSDIILKYYETKIKNKCKLPNLQTIHTSLNNNNTDEDANIYNNIRDNGAINISITEQDNSAIHMGWILFSNQEPIRKLINKYFCRYRSTSLVKFNKIIMRYWRTQSNGITLYSSHVHMYEAIPHNMLNNQKILLRTHLVASEYNKFSFRFLMQVSSLLLQSMETMENFDRLSRAAILEGYFEPVIINGNNKEKRRVSNYEKVLFNKLLNSLDWKYLCVLEDEKNLNTSSNTVMTIQEKRKEEDLNENKIKESKDNKVPKYKIFVMELPKDIKEMYGIYNY
jgi:hypothetical protein